MQPRSRRRLATLITCFLSTPALLGVTTDGAAAEDPAGLPVIVAPAAGQVVQGDFAGPITLDFSAVARASRWDVSAVSSGGCAQPAGTSRCSVSTQVDVAADAGAVEVTLPEPLGRSGDYELTVVEAIGGPAVTSTFTITGATDDTTPDPVPQPSVPGGSFVSPSYGARVEEGFTGPVTIDFNQTGESSAYVVRIERERTGYATVYPTSSGGRQQISIPALAEAGEYSLELRNYETGTYYDETALTVLAPVPTVRIERVAPTPFYPTVRDGFRDTVTVRFHIDQRSNVGIRVRNDRGRTVFTRSLGNRAAGDVSYTWSGRDGDGKAVPKGKYRVEVRATNPDGRTGKAAAAVRATSDVVTRRGDDSWRGTQTDRRSKRGNCFIRGYGGELTLDCWAGAYARAEYDFRVPSSATDLRYVVRGQRNCCDDGRISFTGRRVSGKRYTVAVTVTNWRSYTIRRVDLTYSYRARR